MKTSAPTIKWEGPVLPNFPWILVSEGLPQGYSRCLVFAKPPNEFFLQPYIAYRADGEWKDAATTQPMTSDVVFWQYLPSPPSSGEERWREIYEEERK